MNTSRQNPDTGAAMVEFSIVAVVLIVLVFGILDFGRLMITQSSVNATAREGARYGSSVGDNGSGVLRYLDCDGIRAAAQRGEFGIDIPASAISVSYDNGPGTSAIGTCPAGGVGPAGVTAGDRIIVSLTHDFTFAMPLFEATWGPWVVGATDRRTIFP